MDSMPKAKLTPNRRARRRIGEIKKVRFKVLVAREGEGFLQNLSEDGGCLLLNEELSPGTLIQLDIDGLDSIRSQVRVIGRIKWQNGYLTGVQFLKD